VSEYVQQTPMTISQPTPWPFLQVLPYGFVVAPRRILYGLGSGEEQVSTSCFLFFFGSWMKFPTFVISNHARVNVQDAENHAAVALGTFAGQDAYAEQLLGEV
jgi:hypothetical protein